MARTSITVSSLTRNAGTNVSATVGQGATGSNGWSVNSFDRDEITLLIENTGGTTGAVEVKAPTSGDLSTSKGVGDLSIVIGGSVEMAIIVDGARFKQSDGAIYVDGVDGGGTAFTGSIRAIDPTGM